MKQDSGGSLSVQIVLNNSDVHSITFDLPAVAPIAKKNINKLFLLDRISVVSGNFFTDEFPSADLITMGNILHDWDLDQKQALIAKAYAALPAGGALVVIENIIDEQRKQNAFGLMMSLNMLIETPGGFDYTAADFTHWAVKAGFSHVEIMPLGGPASALIAYK